jgi:hypothetical protein
MPKLLKCNMPTFNGLLALEGRPGAVVLSLNTEPNGVG